ncbi:hypothetical protein [Burkholderia multivorans]|uniref:hypothetical protein n=1 Tax=Burkholderia multivorans TaxID=87883 RepID=UPI0021BEC9F0|nr:hypothetical protein [Burkholderia multivorans]
MVVEGTPSSITYKVGAHSATARWKKANTFIGAAAGGTAAMKDDQPAGFDGFTNRLVMIGTRPALEPVRRLHASMTVGGFVKALVPQGWTGSAQKDVDLTTPENFATRDGENWMQALDRLMTQAGLYADVDFTARHVRLHGDAPKSAALNYASASREADEAGLNRVVARVAGLFDSGLTLRAALDRLMRMSDPWMRWHLRRMSTRLTANPDKPMQALDTGIFSETTIDIMTDAAGRDQFVESIKELGQHSLSRVVDAVKRNAKITHYVLLGGAVMLFLVFGLGSYFATGAVAFDGASTSLNQKF